MTTKEQLFERVNKALAPFVGCALNKISIAEIDAAIAVELLEATGMQPSFTVEYLPDGTLRVSIDPAMLDK
jgi:hypothetical protein